MADTVIYAIPFACALMIIKFLYIVLLYAKIKRLYPVQFDALTLRPPTFRPL